MGQFPGPVKGSWKGRPKAQGLRTPRKRRSWPGGKQRLDPGAVAAVVAAVVAGVAGRLTPWEARNECGAARRKGSSWQAARLAPSVAARAAADSGRSAPARRRQATIPRAAATRPSGTAVL